MPSSSPAPVGRAERILAFMVAGTIGLSILAFLAVIIATAAGVSADAFGGGLWSVVIFIPYIGLPLGILLLIALVVVSAVRRSREARKS